MSPRSYKPAGKARYYIYKGVGEGRFLDNKLCGGGDCYSYLIYSLICTKAIVTFCTISFLVSHYLFFKIDKYTTTIFYFNIKKYTIVRVKLYTLLKNKTKQNKTWRVTFLVACLSSQQNADQHYIHLQLHCLSQKQEEAPHTII